MSSRKELEATAELESIRLRPRGDILVDLFKKIGEEKDQEIRYGFTHVELVRKIQWDESFDYKGAAVLRRFSNSDLRLGIFRFYEDAKESHSALLWVENKLTSGYAGREWPVILVSLDSPMAVNTTIFRRVLEILNDLEEMVAFYGIDPEKIPWQSSGAEDKK